MTDLGERPKAQVAPQRKGHVPREATIRELDLKVDSMDRKLYDQRKFQEQAKETYAGFSCADLQLVIAHKESIIQELERRKENGAKVGCKRGRDQAQDQDQAKAKAHQQRRIQDSIVVLLV